MRKLLSLLLLATFVLTFTSCAQNLPVYKNGNSANEFPPVITAPDGVKYAPVDVSQWYFIEPNAVGITDWTKQTIYSAKADGSKNVIYYKKSFDEALVYYAREGFAFPKLDREGIDSVEWVTDEGQAGKNIISERSIADRVMDAINGIAGKAQADVPAVEVAKLYLYSNKAPGLVFRTAIWLWDGKYFIINLSHQSVLLDNDLVEILKQRKGN